MLRTNVLALAALCCGACDITLTKSSTNSGATAAEPATDTAGAPAPAMPTMEMPAASGSSGAGGSGARGSASPSISTGATPAMTGIGSGGSSASTVGTSDAGVPTAQVIAGAMSSAAGSSGMDGSASTGMAGDGALQPGSLQCPNEVCAPLPPISPDAAAMAASFGVMFSIANCCASTGDCGTSINMGDCVRTPDSDPQCPTIDAMGFTVPSCCTSAGQCGIDASAVMMGCIDLGTVGSMAMGFLTVPPAQSCTPMQ